MYIVRTYRLNNQKDIESELKVNDKDKAISLADAIFEATKQTVEVLGAAKICEAEYSGVVYQRMTPKNAFDRANSKVREKALMETAMRIMDIYDEMVYSQHLNPDKLDSVDYMESFSSLLHGLLSTMKHSLELTAMRTSILIIQKNILLRSSRKNSVLKKTK